jgi:two-component system nitrogen regulation response regulator GlnG
MMDAPGDHVPRFLASSQMDPQGLIEGGRVRQDLFYRLDGAAIAVPSLRERVEDIALLTEHFLTRAERDGAPRRWLSEGAA